MIVYGRDSRLASFIPVNGGRHDGESEKQNAPSRRVRKFSRAVMFHPQDTVIRLSRWVFFAGVMVGGGSGNEV
jgi:hypothetical protein